MAEFESCSQLQEYQDKRESVNTERVKEKFESSFGFNLMQTYVEYEFNY